MANAGADKNYQDFEPTSQWISETGIETLVVDLPGFKKDQLRVQVTASRKLRLTGERPAGGNKWIRLRKEIPIPPNLDIESISARFVGGKLYIEHPKEQPRAPQTKLPTQPQEPERRGVDQPETKRDDPKPTTEDRKTEETKPSIEEGVGAKTTQRRRTIPEKEETETEEAENGKRSKAEAKSPLMSEGKANVGWMVKENTNKRLTLFNLVAVILIVLLIVLYARNAVRFSWENLKDE